MAPMSKPLLTRRLRSKRLPPKKRLLRKKPREKQRKKPQLRRQKRRRAARQNSRSKNKLFSVQTARRKQNRPKKLLQQKHPNWTWEFLTSRHRTSRFPISRHLTSRFPISRHRTSVSRHPSLTCQRLTCRRLTCQAHPSMIWTLKSLTLRHLTLASLLPSSICQRLIFQRRQAFRHQAFPLPHPITDPQTLMTISSHKKSKTNGQLKRKRRTRMPTTLQRNTKPRPRGSERLQRKKGKLPRLLRTKLARLESEEKSFVFVRPTRDTRGATSEDHSHSQYY